MNALQPTPYPDVNELLLELLPGVRGVLGSGFVGMYLDGSLAIGDFDGDSDIDFVVVTEEDVSDACFSALQTLHERIAAMDSRYATDLEGSYLSRRALRRYDPAHALHPNIERGRGERLKQVRHDAAWTTHRTVLREHGITLTGPAPQTLIDPVSPDDLRQAMRSPLSGWLAHILDDPAPLQARGYQSYTVLTLCRVLYTLQHGTIVSKRVAARGARETLGERWLPLIERAWTGRSHPAGEASPEDRNETLEFIQYVRDKAGYQP